MTEVEQLIYGRMTNDTEATNGLVALLTDTSHILHAYQEIIPEVPYLTFHIYSEVKGQLQGNFTRTYEVFVEFSVYSQNYLDIIRRLRRLFDGYRFDIPGNYTEVGSVNGVFDQEGVDGFDETLEVQFKQVRFRFFVTPKAWSPITA